MQNSRLTYTKQVFRIICENSGVTRNEIAALTPKSLMSVGKAVDSLISANLVTEHPSTLQNVGRRAGILTPTDGTVIILDLTARLFRIELYDIHDVCTYSLSYVYNSEILFLDNLCIFADNVNALLKARKTAPVLGAGILVTGKYDEKSDTVNCARTDDFFAVTPMKLFSKAFDDIKTVISDDVSMGAAYALENEAPDSSCAIYMKLDNRISSALVVDGKVFCGIPSKRKFDDPALEYKNSFISLLTDAAAELASYMSLCLPDTVLVETATSVFSSKTSVTETLSKLLVSEHGIPKELVPKLIVSGNDGTFSRKGMIDRIITSVMNERIR